MFTESFHVESLSRTQNNQTHHKVWKGILNFGLKYKRSKIFELIRYFDSDYARDHEDRKIRYFFLVKI